MWSLEIDAGRTLRWSRATTMFAKQPVATNQGMRTRVFFQPQNAATNNKKKLLSS
jgi:hypothetical protein